MNVSGILSSFRFESTFGAWLKKILVNKCINQLKKKKIDLTLCENLPAILYEEEDEVIYDTGKIFKGIEKLPDGYRVILTLYLLEGYDHTEISQILGYIRINFKISVFKSKRKIKKYTFKKLKIWTNLKNI